ncbi:hypothetical protein BXZ70DRAFT_488866 [Cristinia sonorae]|uniref:Uncharacterized protein n=1 Tax=Cristinia sonorae TaxID=1940300 RepID=A0A8K0UJ15_9AGAR|nr:hypothetical protein BXZ70DRAFT_488866 [Cristinia sonorae]
MSFDNNNFNNDPNAFGASGRGARASDSTWNNDPTTNTTDFTDTHLGQTAQAQQHGLSQTQRGTANAFDNPTTRGHSGTAGSGGIGSTAYPGDTQNTNVPGTGTTGTARTGFGRTGSGTQWDDDNAGVGSGVKTFGSGGPGPASTERNWDNKGTAGGGNQFASSEAGRTGKPSMGDRVKGGMEKVAGKVAGRTDMVERGQERQR